MNSYLFLVEERMMNARNMLRETKTQFCKKTYNCDEVYVIVKVTLLDKRKLDIRLRKDFRIYALEISIIFLSKFQCDKQNRRYDI